MAFLENMNFKLSHHCMVQFDEQHFMLIGHDGQSNPKRNRYLIYDLFAQEWLPERQDPDFPKGNNIASQKFCDAFKADGKTTVFMTGHGYSTYLYDVASKDWTTGKFEKAVVCKSRI